MKKILKIPALKEEAIKRMQILELSEKAVDDFESTGKVYFSDETGNILPLSECDDPVLQIVSEKVKAFEEKEGVLVYHVVKAFSRQEELWGFLFVENRPKLWDEQKYWLNMRVVTNGYEYRRTFPQCSKKTAMGVRKENGGLVRYA